MSKTLSNKKKTPQNNQTSLKLPYKINIKIFYQVWQCVYWVIFCQRSFSDFSKLEEATEGRKGQFFEGKGQTCTYLLNKRERSTQRKWQNKHTLKDNLNVRTITSLRGISADQQRTLLSRGIRGCSGLFGVPCCLILSRSIGVVIQARERGDSILVWVFPEVNLKQAFECKQIIWEIILEIMDREVKNYNRKGRNSPEMCITKPAISVDNWNLTPLENQGRQYIKKPHSLSQSRSEEAGVFTQQILTHQLLQALPRA